MKTVADIMTRKLVTLPADANIHQARELLKQHNIRHLPIVNAEGQYEGLLTQRDLLNSAFSIVEKYGVSKLVQKEEQIQVAEVMSRDSEVMPSDAALIKAGEFFLAHKHSCLPVVDNGRLCGILTSIDFVRLSLHLLKNE